MIDLALAMQVLVFFTVLACFFLSGQASLFHPVTWYLVFHGIVFVVRPILVHDFGFDHEIIYMSLSLDDDLFVRTLMVSSVGLICFVVACMLAGKSAIVFCNQPESRFTLPESCGLLISTLLLSPMIGYSIYSSRSMPPSQMINGISVMTEGTGYVYEFANILAPLLCVWLVRSRFHWLNLIPVTLYIGYRTWYGWSRWTIVLFIVMVALSYCWQRRLKWVPLWSAGLAVPLFLLFTVVGQNRDLLKNFFEGTTTVYIEKGIAGLTPETKARIALDGPDFANFDFLAYIVKAVPELTKKYTYGLQYLQILTEPIPRILWREKPVGAPVETIDIGAYGNFVGRTFSLCGDGWTSGGWIGLVITLSLSGALLGWAHRWFWRNTDNNLSALLYITNMGTVIQWYRDGGISIAKFLLWCALPIVVWLIITWLISDKAKRVPVALVGANTRLRLTSNPNGAELIDSQ